MSIIREKNHQRVLKLTLLVTAFMVLLAALANVLWAEEIEPVELKAPLEKAQEGKSLSETKLVSKDSNPLGLRVTPMFGIIRPADQNPWLFNKYSAGFSAEIPVSENISIEGVFRYAMFDVRPTLRKDYFGLVPTLRVQYGYSSVPGAHIGAYTIGEMRQIMIGGNLKYELFPKGILSPFIGTGLSYFDNEYFSKSDIRLSFPQSVYGANALGGLKLRLARELALVGQAEGGTLLNNRSATFYGANIQHRENFRSYDKYWTAMAGISFGL